MPSLTASAHTQVQKNVGLTGLDAARAIAAQKAAAAALAAANSPAQIAAATAQKIAADAAAAVASAKLSQALSAHVAAEAAAAKNAALIAKAKKSGSYVSTRGKPKGAPGATGPAGLTNAQIDAQIAVLNQKILDVTASGGGDLNALIAQVATINDLKAQIAALEAQRPAAPATPDGSAPPPVLFDQYGPDAPPPAVEWHPDGSTPLGVSPTVGPKMSNAYSQDIAVPTIAPADAGYNPVMAADAPPASTSTAIETSAAPAPTGLSAFVAAHKTGVIAGSVGVCSVLGLIWYYLTPKK